MRVSAGDVVPVMEKSSKDGGSGKRIGVGGGGGAARGGICNEEIGMALLLMVEGQQGCKNE